VTLVQVVVSGLLIGGVYALLASGITLVLGVMKVVNFAQGELLMVAMFATLLLHEHFGVHPYVALPLVTAGMFLLGLLLHGGLLRWTISGGHTQQIVLTLGVAISLQSLALLFLGGDYRTLRMDPFLGGSLQLGGISIGTTRLAAFVIAVLATGALLLLLDRTLLGKAIRATAMDSNAAQLMGIPVQRVYLVTMGIGVALAGTAGAALMPIFSVYPTVGVHLLLMGFVVVVLGGLGSVAGAFLGGLIIGVIEAASSYLISASWSQAIVFAFFMIILLVRPQGLLRGDVA
jgi:branched-chain amino acid transport system permease protein